MNITTIPLSELGPQFPRFLTETTDDPSLLLDGAPPDDLRDISGISEDHRQSLVESILSDLSHWHAPESARSAAQGLAETNAYAVVTGQQAGFATGPMYTIYKALGAIVLAKRYAEAFPDATFVPVFWIEGDDHDFEEARTVVLAELSGDARTLRYDDGDESRRHVGDRAVDSTGLEAFLTEAREILGDTDFTDDLFTTIREAYGADATLADGFARTMYGLLGDTDLVLVSSRNPGLKRLAAEVFATEAADPELLFEAVKGRTYELSGDDIPTPIDPKPGALFITHDGLRRSLVPDGDGYIIRDTDERLTRADASDLARSQPERFSPNVALRPLVQDAILPTAVYVGGPSEVAYLRQLRDAYPMFGMSQPAIAPRPFVTLVERKAERGLEQTGVDIRKLFDPEFDPATFLLDEETERELERITTEAGEMISKGFSLLESLTNDLDESLTKSLEASSHKAGKELENFSGRLRGALKRKNETAIKRIDNSRSLLLPGGSLQERAMNPMYFVNKFGLETFRAACNAVDLAPGSMQFISL